MKKRFYVFLSFILLTISSPSSGDTFAQVGFSPDGDRDSARALTLCFIRSAEKSLRVMAYTFSARDIANALVEASRSGIDVKIVLDQDASQQNPKTMAMLRKMKLAGIGVHLDGAFQIQHDKVMISDDQNVETGSFNYSWSAEEKNSENALVIWHLPSLAQSYLNHWKSRWNLGHRL